jgi:phenylpyruvate tautomerase PptA (4-oxalocrotonate tautomerase family)
MPLVRISLLRGKSPDYLRAVADAVHRSLVECYDMDDRDRFQIIEEFEPGRLVFDRDYAGGPRSDDFIIVGVTSRARTTAMKEAFYKRLVERLAESPGMRPHDLFVHLACGLDLEDISFAHGLSAPEMARRYGRER